MSGDLWIGGGGGSVRVATADLLQLMDRLDRAAVALGRCRREIRLAAVEVPSPVLALLGGIRLRLEDSIDTAAAGLALAEGESTVLARALGIGADGYGLAEQAVSDATRVAAASVAMTVGSLATSVGLLALPGILAGGLAAAGLYALVRRVAPEETALAVAAARAELESHRGILSESVFVELVRLTTMSVDDVAAGALRVPVPVAAAVGDEGLGVLGLDTTAALLLAAAGPLGMLRETGVSVRQTGRRQETVAAGFAGRAERIPTGEAQIRIDRHPVPGGADRFDVYVGGTREFDAVTGTEPFDLTSDIGSVAGRESGAYRAVEEAMQEAGVGADSEITLSGYSQGGLVAAMLAASGDYDVRGLYTLGAPAGQVEVPAAIPWIALEHTDDLVPVVGGSGSAADPVLVRRQAAVDIPPGDDLVPAHGLARYRETAALADAALAPPVDGVEAAFGAVGQGSAAVVSTWYVATRIDEPRSRPLSGGGRPGRRGAG
jgi:hypothetical protein